MIRAGEKRLGIILALTMTFVANVATGQAPTELPCDPCIISRNAALQAGRSLAMGDRRAAASFLALKWLGETGSGSRKTDDLERIRELVTEADDFFAAGVVNLILGLDRAAQGDTATAESNLRRAIEHFGAIHEPLLVDSDGPGGIFLELLDLPGRVSGLASLPSARPESAARAGEALAHSILAEVLEGQGRLGAAEVEYLRAIDLSPLDHLARSGLGKVFRAQGRSADARRAFAEALAALDAGRGYEAPQRAIGVRLKLLYALASLDRAAGDAPRTLEWFAEIEALLPSIENAELEASARGRLVVLADAAGNFEAALRHASAGADLMQRLGMTEGEGLLRQLAASFYLTFDARDRAYAEFERAELLVKSEQSLTLQQVLNDALWLGERDAEFLPEMVEHLQKLGDVSGEGVPGLDEKARTLKAISDRKDLAIADANRRMKSSGSEVTAPADFMERHAEAARPDAVRLLELSRRAREPQALISSLGILAGIELLLSRPEAAVALLREAVDLVEQIARSTGLDELHSSVLAKQSVVYHYLVGALTKTRQHEEAFAYSERARARSLLGLLGHTRPNPEVGAEKTVTAEDETGRARLLALESQARAALDAESLAATRLKAEAARKELEDLTFRIKLSSPWSADLAQVKPLELTEVQALLPLKTTLVSFLVTDAQTHAWIVTPGRFEALTIEVRSEWLVDQVSKFRQEIATRTSGDRDRGVRLLDPVVDSAASLERAGDELAHRLLVPLLQHIRTSRLLLVPHGVLHDLPFAALRHPETGRFLVEDYELSYAPSASALRYLERRSGEQKGTALVLGDPEVAENEDLLDLGGARREAQRISRFLGVTPHLGAEATETLLREQARGVDVLHVAAHNVPSPSNPRFSYLALAPDEHHDGKLEMREIFEELDLQGIDLVTLSACETALGERTEGDEVMGLTRALLHAGAGSVLATLWSVDDQASATLMILFYARLQAGESAAQALAEAQRELLATEGTAAPFYWAAFTLVGEPRRGAEDTSR